eukprot:4103507-Amphidinium_carterae.1
MSGQNQLPNQFPRLYHDALALATHHKSRSIHHSASADRMTGRSLLQQVQFRRHKSTEEIVHQGIFPETEFPK